MERRWLEYPWVDRPLSALDVFVRYVLGVRRFTEAYLAAVERYLEVSWGGPPFPGSTIEDITGWFPSAFLDEFSDRERRRSPDRFVRTMPALFDRRPRTTWRTTPSGLLVIDSENFDLWQELPAAGWEALLVLWVSAGDRAAERRERFEFLQNYCLAGLTAHRRLLTSGQALTTGEIVDIAAMFVLSPLNDRTPERRAATVRAQLRWLAAGGFVRSRTRRTPPQLTEPFHYIDLWGWEWLRQQIERTLYATARDEFSCSELLREIVTKAAGRYRSDIWTPEKVTLDNAHFTITYQKTQRILIALLDEYPHRWKSCAQEYRINDIAFEPTADGSLGTIPIPPGQPIPQDARRSWRQIDAVLWQAGDPSLYPSVLIEVDIRRTESVRNHLITALHVATKSGRPTTLIYVAGHEAMAHVRRTLFDELEHKRLANNSYLWPGACLRVRLVTLRAATNPDPLRCPAIYDRTFHAGGRHVDLRAAR